MLKRTFLVVGVLVVLAGGALGAALVVSDDGSSQGGSKVSIAAIQLAADNTAATESMQFELHSSGMLGVSASGVVSGDGKQAKVSVDLGALGSVEQRIVDGTIYVGGGNLLGGQGGKWLTITSDDLQGALGASGALGDVAESPTSALDLLNDLAGPVETIGDDTVAGQHATHYRVSVDAEGTDASVDVWIDDHDRVVKVQGSSPDGGEITFEVTAFGVPVDVQAPPTDQIVQLPDFKGSLGAGVI